jgi:hypothetical protein
MYYFLHVKRALYHLVPSFLQAGGGLTQRLHPTSYLDGLRGIAALVVFCMNVSILSPSPDLPALVCNY